MGFVMCSTLLAFVAFSFNGILVEVLVKLSLLCTAAVNLCRQPRPLLPTVSMSGS